MPTEEISYGLPVDPALISRELKKLWQNNEGATTRASLINFLVFCEGSQSMKKNTDFIREFTSHHACRALLVAHEPGGTAPKLNAWIDAHCHLSRAGAKSICCEQITLVFQGNTRNWIASSVFANLDSDLPLVVWWQAGVPLPDDYALLARVDRFIFDSQRWESGKGAELKLLLDAIRESHARLSLCDLNWTRTLRIRQALAQMFDFQENRVVLDNLKAIEIAHMPEFRSTAILLLGWFAAQLNLDLVESTGDQISLVNDTGYKVAVTLCPEAGRSISRCVLTSDQGSVQTIRDQAGDFFRVEVRLGEENVYRHLLPAGSNDTTALLLEELTITGQHRVYQKALSAIQSLI